MAQEHKADGNTLNLYLNFCIDEYVRLEQHREILREHWFCGWTFEQIAERHGLSVTAVKKIIYNIGDNILLRADEMSQGKRELLPLFAFLRSLFSQNADKIDAKNK